MNGMRNTSGSGGGDTGTVLVHHHTGGDVQAGVHHQSTGKSDRFVITELLLCISV